MTRNASQLFCKFLFVVFVLTASSAAYLLLRPVPGGEENKIRYLRAVYVLKRLGGPAAAEPDAVPPRIMYDDDTESLLHHPDKILVLRRMAGELAACGNEYPRARLFEAYARLGMGDKQAAAALLMRYVVLNEYNAGQYALLCRTLYETEDITALLIICREWAERDPPCRDERARYLFTALYDLGRFSDAEESMREAETCLGWQAVPHAAQAALAAGDRDRAESLIEEGVSRYTTAEKPLRRLWERLKNGTVPQGGGANGAVLRKR